MTATGGSAGDQVCGNLQSPKGWLRPEELRDLVTASERAA
jgi:hypothetical protein